jgi:hypothetical protein
MRRRQRVLLGEWSENSGRQRYEAKRGWWLADAKGAPFVKAHSFL